MSTDNPGQNIRPRALLGVFTMSYVYVLKHLGLQFWRDTYPGTIENQTVSTIQLISIIPELMYPCWTTSLEVGPTIKYYLFQCFKSCSGLELIWSSLVGLIGIFLGTVCNCAFFPSDKWGYVSGKKLRNRVTTTWISLPGKWVTSRLYLHICNTMCCNLGGAACSVFFIIEDKGLWSDCTNICLP